MAENTTESAAPAPVADSAPAAPATTATNEAGTVQQVPGAENKDAKKPQGFIEGLMANPMMLIILAAVWIWFFYSMKKNKRRQQEHKEKLNQINKGDKVVTIGRVHGVVVDTDDKTFTIKPDTKKDYTLTFDREALLRVENRPDADSANS